MLEIYLPIAQVKVDIFLLLFLSFSVGVLSGLFGVGGGFLMTPFLIFMGIPPVYAVPNEVNNILATSVSGSLTHWFKNTLDYKMGLLIVSGGVVGTLLGITTFTYFSEIGKISLIISLLYMYLLAIVGTGVLCLTLFVLTAKAAPGLFPNRVDTWMSRIESFSNPEDSEANYQIEKAKIAIATGGIVGKGAGKSIQKNFLPQSSSDFIYAIIVEEYGLIGGVALMLFYLFLLFRITVVANSNATIFGKLLVLGVGLPIIFQALINMAVAVELFPVTGQNLPLVSRGGTSSWMTCLAIGIILGASNKEQAVETRSTSIDETNPLEILSGQL